MYCIITIPKYQRYWVLSLGIVSGGLTIAMWGLQIHVQPRAYRLRLRPRALPAFASHWQAQRSAPRLCVFDTSNGSLRSSRSDGLGCWLFLGCRLHSSLTVTCACSCVLTLFKGCGTWVVAAAGGPYLYCMYMTKCSCHASQGHEQGSNRTPVTGHRPV